MPQIIAQLFGGMELRDADGRELIIETRKARALLAYLIVECSRWHSRERLAGLLWGERGETQARNSLNQALYEVRKIETATNLKIVERETDRLRLSAGSIDCDLYRFGAMLSADPMAAADLCTGRLLEGLDLGERDFMDWLNQKRAHYQESLAEVFRELAGTTDKSLEARIGAARQLVRLDPLDESARRQLMELLAQSGNRGEAIRQYQICADLLQEALGIRPSPETQRLMERIKQPHASSQPQTSFAPDVRMELSDAPSDDGRPIVAVLPFANLSDDPGFAYFANGLAEEVIFSLSAFRWFRVLAQAATFTLRDANAGHSDIQRMFGATHVVTGRVRRAGNKLRFSVELGDCRTGQQLWAGRHDRKLDDLFDVLDEVTRSVVAGIEPAIEDSEMRRALRAPVQDLAAYELLLRGYWHLYRGSLKDHDEAKRCFEAALARDSSYAGALAALAFVKYREAHANPVKSFVQALEESRATAAEALELDPRDPRALKHYGGASCFLGDQDTALAAVSQSIALCPNYASAYSGLAFVHDFKGNFSEAASAADKTIRLRPHDPALHKCVISKAIAHYQTGEYERAERIAKDSLRTNNTWWVSNMMLAASLAQRGHVAGAGVAAQRIRADQPGITLEIMLRTMPFANAAHSDHLAGGLIRAGWRDG